MAPSKIPDPPDADPPGPDAQRRTEILKRMVHYACICGRVNSIFLHSPTPPLSLAPILNETALQLQKWYASGPTLTQFQRQDTGMAGLTSNAEETQHALARFLQFQEVSMLLQDLQDGQKADNTAVPLFQPTSSPIGPNSMDLRGILEAVSNFAGGLVGHRYVTSPLLSPVLPTDWRD